MGITSVRLSPEVEEKLAAVAERARRTKSWIINEAVRDYQTRSAGRRRSRPLHPSGPVAWWKVTM